MATHEHFDYAIIGGGCIGASTALALQREYPDARIAWLEGTATHTASKDINKIIRTPYPDEDYVAFATKAMEKWEKEELYRVYYHKVGWIQVISEGSYRSTRKGPNDNMISDKEMLDMVGSLDKPHLITGEELWLNKEIGYVDSHLALEAVAIEASRLGVKRKQIDAKKILVDEGICKGIEVGDGSIVASKTILAAGPWTPEILSKSGVVFPPSFFTSAGVVLATIPLTEDEYERLNSMPILVSDEGEIMPSKLCRALKISTTRTFEVKRLDELNNNSTLDTTPNRTLLEKMLPEFTGRALESWACPDLITPLQHQIIDEIPTTQQLYVATGGSYHSFKFLPLIGDMVVRRLQGRHEPDTVEGRLLRRWGWERAGETVAIHKSIVPRELEQN